MKKCIAIALILTALLCASACAEYQKVTAVEAKEIMDAADDYVLVDVRTQNEYDEGHIEGAVCIPFDEINDRAEAELPDKDQLILVYCNYGIRSEDAMYYMLQLGYTEVRQFGGLDQWPDPLVK